MNREQKIIFFTIMVVAFMTVSSAFALNAPTEGSFAYDIYDLAVNRILNGPIGFVAGIGAIVFSAVLAMKNMALQAIGTLLGGGMLIAADNIVSTMGAMII